MCLHDYSVMMDVFSLEEDDYNNLFITQTSKESVPEGGVQSSPILGDGNNFLSPLVSVESNGELNSLGAHSEDKSDEDFEIPPSQKNEGNTR